MTISNADYGKHLKGESSETKRCLENKDKNGCRSEVRDYDSIWKVGMVICQTCGKFIRYFNAD